MGAKKLSLVIFFFVFSLVFAQIVFAKTGHIKLLAVSEENGKYKGSTADLYLEIKPGEGRVYIDTFPITKLDTQMTTRFAKEMACKYLDVDCSGYDFFYTISSDSSIIGGPSAGAATTILTISVLGDITLDEDTLMTGTINSGYLIGHVGGLKEKIEAAGKVGATKVLIPKSDSIIDENNITTNLTLLGKNFSVDVIEASDIEEALSYFTNKPLKKIYGEIITSETYDNIMKNLAISLCNRTVYLKASINYSHTNKSEFEYVENLTDNSFTEFENKRYYSSASLCFGANVNYLQEYFLEKNLSTKEYDLGILKTSKEIDVFLQKIEQRNADTVTDLEANIVVRERLADSKAYLDQVSKANTTKEKARLISYSLERLNSAYLWDRFYGIGGKKIELDDDSLEKTCKLKISEAEERYQYANLYFPELLGEIHLEIEQAYEYLNKKEYTHCLFSATKAKARSNIILSSISVNKEKIDVLLDQKLAAAKKTISEEISKGVFPVVGYSYYEYANTLKKDDQFSALIYSEYALELSNLDIYFKEKKQIQKISVQLDFRLIIMFILGVLTGMMLFFLIFSKKILHYFELVKKNPIQVRKTSFRRVYTKKRTKKQ